MTPEEERYRSMLIAGLEHHGSYRKLQRDLFPDDPAIIATLQRIVKHGVFPPTAKGRHRLGLSATEEVPVCPECGHAHVLSYCPKTRKQQQRNRVKLHDRSIKELTYMLENREKM